VSRALLVLANDDIRAKAARWIKGVPNNTRVEFKAPRRSLDQNSRFWASLTDVATQKEHFGRKYDAETWKCLFMQAWGREVKFVPTLAGDGIMPVMLSSSDLSKGEMSELLEFIYAWGAQNGVVFQEPRQ
jgi:NinB protein